MRLLVAAATVVALGPVLVGGQASALPALPGDLVGAIPDLGQLMGSDAAPLVSSPTPGVARRSARLMAEHDCWAGESPDDVTDPGHVVVTRLVEGRTVTTYGGPRLVERARRHVFEQADPAIFIVHGFCR